MTILVDITYEVVTEESAECGEADETGFELQDDPCTFRELVELLRGHREPSSWPMREAGPRDWFTSDMEQDYRTGEHRRTSVHLSRANGSRALKYWNKAARAAGLLAPIEA
jgi:hypothetical protein